MRARYKPCAFLGTSWWMRLGVFTRRVSIDFLNQDPRATSGKTSEESSVWRFKTHYCFFFFYFILKKFNSSRLAARSCISPILELPSGATTDGESQAALPEPKSPSPLPPPRGAPGAPARPGGDPAPPAPRGLRSDPNPALPWRGGGGPREEDAHAPRF